MSNEMEIIINGYDNVLKEIQSMKSKSEKVVNRTIADFKSRGPGWVAQEVTKVYNIKKSDVNKDKKGVKKTGSIKAMGTRLDNLSLIYRGRPLTLTHFNMTPTKPPELSEKRVTIHIPGVGFRNVRQRKKVDVKATIYKGHKKVIKGEYDTPIFIQENPQKAGQYLPFQRTGRKLKNTSKGTEKDELVLIKKTSVEQMIENETVAENIHTRINEGLGKRLDHHLKQALK